MNLSYLSMILFSSPAVLAVKRACKGLISRWKYGENPSKEHRQRSVKIISGESPMRRKTPQKFPIERLSQVHLKFHLKTSAYKLVNPE